MMYQAVLRRLSMYQHQLKKQEIDMALSEQNNGYIKFELGVPQTVTLAGGDPLPKRGFNDELQHMYKLVGGKVMYVPPGLTEQFKARGIHPGQEFQILKQRGPDGRNVEWKIQVAGERRVEARWNGRPVSVLLDKAEDVLGDTVPSQDADSKVPLNQALKLAIKAAKEAEKYGDEQGYMFRFQSSDIVEIALEMSRS